MFNGLIDSTQVQPQRGSSSRSSGGSTHRRCTEQDIAAEEMEQWMRQNEEYNLQMHEYYRQREEQWDASMAQQPEALQVSMIVNNQVSEKWTLYLYY
jgi:molybdopterin-biosynthesis enzyme MoeA-like protein